MVLRGVSVHWVLYGFGRSINALDSIWFWEEYQCSGWYMVLVDVSVHRIVHGFGRSISAVASTWF